MKALILPVLALAIVSCRPPFDGELSFTASVAGRMRLEATVGPVVSSQEVSDFTEAVFLPLKTGAGVDAQRGFIVFSNTHEGWLWYTEPNGSGGYLTLRNQDRGSLYDSDPRYPVYDCKPLKTGPYIEVTRCKTDDPLYNELYGITTGVPPTMLSSTNFAASTFNPTSGARMLSSQLYPDASTTTDTIFFLFWEPANNGYREMQESIDGTFGLGAAADINGTPYNLSFLPYGIPRCLYYRDPATGASYASLYAGGAWQCWKWSFNPSDPANPFQQRLAGITKRIDALLTTDELLSTQDGVGLLYDPDGECRADFHLGGLKFAFEAYVDGVARVFFSQKYVKNEKIYFQVYSIKTAGLSGL